MNSESSPSLPQSQAAEMVLVPREPTRAMLEAGSNAPQMKIIESVTSLHQVRTGVTLTGLGSTPETCALAEIYRAMVAAASPQATVLPAQQPKPNTEAAHQVAPVGTDLPPALSEDTRDALPQKWNPEPPCWLVEKRAEGRTVAYLGHVLGTSDWMPTPDKATRFVRREDANGVAECFEFEDVIVAEHIWG